MSTVQERFEAWIADNPAIYGAFKRFAFELIDAGRTRFSYEMVIQRIRWETALRKDDEGFKVNDRYTPRLARMFVAEHPQHADCFEFRRLRT